MKKYLSFFLFTFFIGVMFSLGIRIAKGQIIEPHPACPAGQACWPTRKVNQWSCTDCKRDWVCQGNIKKFCTKDPYGEPDDSSCGGSGPCVYVCWDMTGAGCHVWDANLLCDQTPPACGLSLAVFNCSFSETSGCNLDWDLQSFGCCGPGSGATPTPGGGPTPTPSPSCTVNLTPDTATTSVGTGTTLTATVTIGSGTVTQINFSSGNTGIVTVNPASDSTVVYSTQATGVSLGSTTVRSDVIMSGASRCNDTSTVNVITPGPWWQVKDADLTTNGDIISAIPGSCTLPACNPVLGLRGAGGFPGVPAYGGATADFLSGAGTGSAAESPYNWLAASRYLGRTYDYAYFERQIPDDVVFNELTLIPPVTGGTFNLGGAPSRGYVWYHWNGATLGDLTINGNVNLAGSRKVVLMVEGANLTINGRINIQSKGQGFFMAVVGKTTGGLKGDIVVVPSAGAAPHLEGIFLAESEFKTGVSSNQLQVRGSVVAYDGVSLQRDLGAGNANTPAEVFEYAPDIIATFPRVFTQRRMRWKEVAP